MRCHPPTPRAPSSAAQVTEMPSLVMLPNSLLQHVILGPLRHQAAGTILAAGMAIERGWAINLGGGFHHGSWNEGRAW
jgi:histone deacetylase 11